MPDHAQPQEQEEKAHGDIMEGALGPVDKPATDKQNGDNPPPETVPAPS